MAKSSLLYLRRRLSLGTALRISLAHFGLCHWYGSRKEVATRIQRQLQGQKGLRCAFSCRSVLHAKPYLVANVSSELFYAETKCPRSTVINLKRYDSSPVSVHDEKLMFQNHQGFFSISRKERRLSIGLKNSGELEYTKEAIEQAMSKCGLPFNIQGEAMTLDPVYTS